MTSRKKRGRPPFKPTRAMRTTVERMVACGDSQETIARALGIEDDTLRKHFGDELKTGYAKRRRQAVDLLFDGAAKGNASLIKRVEEMTRLAGAAADFDRPDAPRPAAGSRKVKANKLGKKEIAHDKAMVAGSDSDWGDDLRPPPNVLPN